MKKGKIFLIGLGIADEKSISLSGLEILKKSDIIFSENYTNLIPKNTIKRLEKILGKEIILLSRQQVENEKQILDSAQNKTVSFLVPGDPLIATTHISLLISAKKRKIPFSVIHSSSIISAAFGESGLQTYKFGKIVTLAHWRENYKPLAPYETILENQTRGLHTLLLLDIDEKLGPLYPEMAAKILLEMEKIKKQNILLPQTKIIVLQGIGWKNQKTAFLSLKDLLNWNSKKGDPPAVLIVPGKLHFLEEEFLNFLNF
jgi:diphthine synthase